MWHKFEGVSLIIIIRKKLDNFSNTKDTLMSWKSRPFIRAPFKYVPLLLASSLWTFYFVLHQPCAAHAFAATSSHGKDIEDNQNITLSLLRHPRSSLPPRLENHCVFPGCSSRGMSASRLTGPQPLRTRYFPSNPKHMKSVQCQMCETGDDAKRLRQGWRCSRKKTSRLSGGSAGIFYWLTWKSMSWL